MPFEAVDLTDQECGDLTDYVAALPAPKRRTPMYQEEALLIKNGEDLFISVGCAVCHRPRLGKVVGIYSDLLMHDMGPQLADPVAASEKLSASPSSTRSAAYYGGGPTLEPPTPLVLERQREWKTPPLWGLRSSAPYLHDGRAATIEDAIALHGGEAAGSLERYSMLPMAERTRLVAFLTTLVAP